MKLYYSTPARCKSFCFFIRISSWCCSMSDYRTVHSLQSYLFWSTVPCTCTTVLYQNYTFTTNSYTASYIELMLTCRGNECTPTCTILWYTRKVKMFPSLNVLNFPKPFKVQYFSHELKGGPDNDGLRWGEAMNLH